MSENESATLKVLVTGATTALGREIVRQLVARGHEVTGLADTLDGANLIREDGGLPAYSDVFRAGEIASTLRMIEADVIINAVTQGINGLPPHNPDWGYYERLLTDATPALLSAAHEAGVKCFVHLSYAFLYGDKHGAAVDESAAISRDDALFKAAASAEQAVLKADVPGCVLRAGFNYGVDTSAVLALRDALHSGSSLPLGDEHNVASWVHIADLASAAVLAAEQQPGGEVFNIAGDSPASPAAFADHFADQYGVKRPGRQRLPGFLIPVMQHPTHRALLATSATVRSEKARNQLGWTPRYPDFHTGIEQALLAWRAHT